MAWIAVHEQIDGIKLRQFRKISGCSKCEAMGILVTLWLWGINNADRNGELKGADRFDLTEMYNYSLSSGLSATSVIEALITTGWIDENDGHLFIHDWAEWQEQWYKALERREKDRQRKRVTSQISSSQESPQNFHGTSVENLQNIHGDSSATVTVTQPSHNNTPFLKEEGTNSIRDAEPTSAKATRHKHGTYGWVKLTAQEYERLLHDLGEAELNRCIKYIDESAQSNGNKNKWKDWNLVIRKCSSQGWGKGSTSNGTSQQNYKPGKYAAAYNRGEA